MRTYTPQSLITNTACKVRAPDLRKPFFNHCCVSSAAAQKQSTCKCQGMDLLLAQRSMIRTKQRMYISTHAPYSERERTHAHTHTYYLERGSARTPYILQERRQCTKHSYAHIHTAIIHHKYNMQSACAPPSSITAAFPLQLRRSKAYANVSAWTYFLRNDR